jgi:hypothetical protein
MVGGALQIIEVTVPDFSVPRVATAVTAPNPKPVVKTSKFPCMSGITVPIAIPLKVTVSHSGWKSETEPLSSTCRLLGPLVGAALKLVITGDGQSRLSKHSKLSRTERLAPGRESLREPFNNPHTM